MLYFIIFIIFILIIYYLIIRFSKQELSDKDCKNVIYDPNTFKYIPISSDRGYQLFKYKMIYYFDKYLQNTKDDWNYILPSEFNKMDKSKYFILDVRKPEDYKKGHIKGSLNIFWLNLLKEENLKKMPLDREIIIVCYVGHTASQILVLLKLLGYKAKVLKFGLGKSPTVGVPIAGWIDYGYKLETK